MTSLRNKINLVFSVTLVLLAALFMASIKYDQSQYLERTEAQEREIVHYIYSYYLQTGKVDEAYLEAQNMSLITDKEMLVQIESFFKEKGKYTRYAVDTFRLKRVLLINNDRFKLILENKNKAEFPFKRIIVFSIVFFLIIMLYMWIIRSLRPLSVLKNKIKTFSQGNLNISCKSDKNDEIAAVANEFDHAVEMIRELLQSRQLFLRAIMHELKTPIGKGRLISEMLPDEKNKARMHSIFERLNLLIDEFAKIEQITSKNFQLSIKPYKASDLVEASIDLLMFENPKQHISIDTVKDFKLEVDFELFTLTLKNLLDNGIKYSIDKHIKVIINQDHIAVENRGEMLQEPIENYFKPFHTSKKGLGLGLYIVKSILDIHKMGLKYEHIEGMNRFIIKK
ncbi:ArsS family sensor histidine kinase [Sulfurovum sp. zt1-1]|uniref:histidine kinase n=1 Tax=Sulfurovum zhangzhouensis TaxID=3019067 RepID=A0ABT7R0R3_9BACT|nr:ArsS family sensor histidine kinase [Sulfurovum zhangzhouensis]MDM5272681.1 ArsS family sensor histidine kinase [Sulfurovum zhangzhouensis]